MFHTILNRFKRRYRRLNTVAISKSALLHNYEYLTKSSGMKIAPVLKSNAYGHGLVEVARIMDTVNAPFLCIDSIYEAYHCLKAKIKTPLLIMGYIHPESLHVKKLPFSYAVYGYEMLEGIARYQPHAGIHIFVDTGMHREGVLLNELSQFVTRAKELNLKIEGVMSHFAMADKPDDVDTKMQVANFKKAQDILNEQKIFPQWVHLAASSGILNTKRYPGHIGNMGRAGIALYGIDPENKNLQLKPVLELKTSVVQIKEVQEGKKVGYDFTFTASENIKVAVLPIGYNDGVDRRLSNKGFVEIKGVLCSVLGRVSMNITAIDVTKISDIKVGDEVVIYSSNPNSKNSITQSAVMCGTIAYELLVHVFPSTKRIVID